MPVNRRCSECRSPFRGRGRARRCSSCYELRRHPKIEINCQRCPATFKGNPGARFCPRCRYIGRRSARKKYDWTPARDAILRERYDGKIRGRAAAIGRELGWPAWVIKKRAAVLGLCYSIDARDWTPEEERFLWDHVGSRTVIWIAKKLRRSESSVVLKCRRLRISRRFKEGYTLSEVMLCFGCDHHVIERWIQGGWLKGRRRGTRRCAGPQKKGPHDPWVFTDEDLLNFIRDHPMEFRLDKVDQLWFMDLVLAGGLIRKALEQARDQETEGAA